MDFPAHIIAECTNSCGKNESHLLIYLLYFPSFSLDAAQRQSLVAARVGVGKHTAVFQKVQGRPEKSELCVLKPPCGRGYVDEVRLKAAKIESQMAPWTC